MKKKLYFNIIVIILLTTSFTIEGNKSTDNCNHKIWLSKAVFKKIGKNQYSCYIKFVNICKDSIFLEVPYPISYDLSASESYFNSINWGRITDKTFYNIHRKEIDSLAPGITHKNTKDFIVLKSGEKLELYFKLYCLKGYRKINLIFSYNKDRAPLMSFSNISSNSFFSLNVNLNKSRTINFNSALYD